MMRPGTGCSATRPDTCLPRLSSRTSGWLSVPVVTDTAASMTSVAACDLDARIPSEHVHEGSPDCGVGLPTEKLDSQPRPRMRISSSAWPAASQRRSEVRY